MIILWLMIGIAAAAAAFIIPGSTDIWESLNFSGITAFIYLVLLTAFTMKKPFSRKTALITWCVLLLVSAAVAWEWATIETATNWQKNRLLKLRALIGHEQMAEEMPGILLPVLKTYHQQAPDGRKTLGQIYAELHPGGTAGRNIHRQEYKLDSLMIFVAAVSDSQIVLVGQESYVRGKNISFKNFNGRFGMLQEKAVLTAKGISYESEN